MTRAVIVLAFASAAILGWLALLHLYWVAGGRFGSGVVVPCKDGKPLFRPSRLSTLAVAIALLLAALVVLGNVGYGFSVVPYVTYRVGIWILSLVFAARAVGDFKYIGFFKTVKNSKFAKMDTLLYTPLCACLGIIFLIMVLNRQ